jgi:tetratricopeptide (TPR) repeat protein
MKPLGTITMYYPFLDLETEKTIDSIMEHTQTYRDFAVTLGKRVCEDDTTLRLVYLAAVHVWHLAELDIMDQIRTKYGDSAIVRPWTLHQRMPDNTGDRHVQVHEAIEDAVRTNPENWILVQLPQASEGFLGPMTGFPKLIEDAGNMLEKHPELECFKSGFHNLNCWVHAMEGDTTKAVSEIELGLEIAERFDDRHRKMKLLTDLANLTKNSDVRSALVLLEDAYLLCTELDSRYDKSVILNEMGLVSTILGEYDLALKCHLDSVRMEESEGSLGFFGTLNLSHAYLNLGDGLAALAWAESAMKQVEPDGTIWSNLTMARALLTLESLEDAAHHLDNAKFLALKSGYESVLGQYYYVQGLYEIAVGDYETAIQTLEQALDIYERHNILLYVVYCLVALSEAELAIVKGTHADLDADTSGPWMTRLERLAKEKDLPGIMMRHSLLKADLQLMQNRGSAARETLENGLDCSHSPGVRTLRERMFEQLELIDGESG